MAFFVLASSGKSVTMIFESILTFIYTQYFIWFAKNIDDERSSGNIFHFRINIMFQFAYMLEDKEVASYFCNLINRNHRYANLKSIKCEIIDQNKYIQFYNAFIQVVMLDYEGEFSSNIIFTGGFTDEMIYTKENYKPNTISILTKNKDGSYTARDADPPAKKKRRYAKLHISARIKANSDIDYLNMLSLKEGGLKLEDIEKDYPRMYCYIRRKYPNFFKLHPVLHDKATTTTLYIWETEGRVFV